jgi:hypothetical protein
MSSNVDQRTGETRGEVMDLAERVWRRVGVRRVDRQMLLAELSSEIAVALDDGGTIDDVLGTDQVQTLREWADARDSSGKALRLAVIVPAALAGLLLAFGTVLLLLIWATVTRNVELPIPIVLTLYGTSGVIALVLAGAGVWLVLRACGDPRARRTVKCLAACLPAGAVVAIGLGVGVARLFHFRHPEISFPLVVLVVLTVMAAAVGAGRYWATKRDRDE